MATTLMEAVEEVKRLADSLDLSEHDRATAGIMSAELLVWLSSAAQSLKAMGVIEGDTNFVVRAALAIALQSAESTAGVFEKLRREAQ